MLIYPAIDLRRGKCVRLQQGERDRETVYSDDPFQTAQTFISQGATWLHVIDLDGAFAEAITNRAIIKKMANSLSARVQCGGGIRTLADVAELLEAGVARVIVGTLAVRQPEIVQMAVEKFGSPAIAVAIDARDGYVAVEGWEKTSQLEMIEFAKRLSGYGVDLIIYTDVTRDGMLRGLDLSGLQLLLQHTTLRIIASGGVRDLQDLQQLRELDNSRLDGVILGRSLYEGTIQLAEAIKTF
jgi:phosphoribosylformimino-5-aminoimidazole carboxamide ribotide isomerase